MKFRVEYKDNPEWNEEFEEDTWSEAINHIGCTATKLEVIEEEGE